jgi:hypothetical protein
MNNGTLFTKIVTTAKDGGPFTLASYAFAVAFGFAAGVLAALELFNIIPGVNP